MPRVLRTGLTISPAGAAVWRLRTAVQRDEDSRRPLISAFVFHAREVATIAHPCFIWQLVSFLAVYEFDPTACDVLSRAEFYFITSQLLSECSRPIPALLSGRATGVAQGSEGKKIVVVVFP